MLRVLQQNYSLTKTSLKMASSQIHRSALVNAKKAVIFDMGGVIIPTPVPLVSAFAKKNNFSSKDMDKLLFDGGDSSLWGKLECGDINTKVFSEMLNQRSQELFGKECQDEIIAKMIKDEKYYNPYPEMMSAIKKLKANGIKTGLLTNNFLMEDGQSVLFLKESFDVVRFTIFVFILNVLYSHFLRKFLNIR